MPRDIFFLIIGLVGGTLMTLLVTELTLRMSANRGGKPRLFG